MQGARDRRGGVGTMFAVALPVILAIIAGAVDLASVNSDRTKMQDVADAAALSAAKQLGVADQKGVVSRTEGMVKDGLKPLAGRLTYQVAAVPTQDLKRVTVTVTGVRSSFFANLLPPGGWKMQVAATAVRMGQVPLCVLTSGGSKADTLDMKGKSAILAPDCLVHGNTDIAVQGGGGIQARAVQASGLASGPITPSPQSSAPEIQDPFKELSLAAKSPSCANGSELVIDAGVQTLGPQSKTCGKVRVRKDAVLQLATGEHYFLKGQLILEDNATLQGENVVLVFDKDSTFRFSDNSTVKLNGRKTGTFAGFVVAAAPQNQGVFTIDTTAARKLVGTVYLPGATLDVRGANTKVNDQSLWTVLVARTLKMSGSPTLVIQAHYGSLNVPPVPKGVGPNGGTSVIRLVK